MVCENRIYRIRRGCGGIVGKLLTLWGSAEKTKVLNFLFFLLEDAGEGIVDLSYGGFICLLIVQILSFANLKQKNIV